MRPFLFDAVRSLLAQHLPLKDHAFVRENISLLPGFLSSVQDFLASPQGEEILDEMLAIATQIQLDKRNAQLIKNVQILPTGIPLVRLDSQRVLSRLLTAWLQSSNGSEDQGTQRLYEGRVGKHRLRTLQEVRKRPGRSVLFLGPNSFREEVWDIRYKYLFPDLYAPLTRAFNIAMLVPDPPRHTIAGLLEVSRRFDVDIYTFMPVAGISRELTWLWAANTLIGKLKPAYITNMQGHTFFGPIMAQLKSFHEFISVLRVAGDEVMARIGLGGANKIVDVLDLLLIELYITNHVDKLIVMSPWEQRRVMGLRRSKADVQMCFRGVDVAKFHSSARDPDFENLRRGKEPTVLYLGRRSLEKGFDKVEAIAQLALERKEPMRMVFAGPGFDPRIEDNKVYIGFVDPDRLPSLLAAVDAIILLSMTESLGQVVLEALACGRYCFVGDKKYAEAFPECCGIVELPAEPLAALDKIKTTLAGTRINIDRSTLIREYAVANLDSRKAQKKYLGVFATASKSEAGLGRGQQDASKSIRDAPFQSVENEAAGEHQ